MSNQKAPHFYTVLEAARILRVHPRTIRRRIRSRSLIATKPSGGRAWLIPESALKQSVNEGVNQ